MQNMLLQVGDMVKVRNVSLPKGTYVKLQPVTSDFLDISNPKAVLERALRSYSCLTVGDVFVVNYNNKNYEIEVREAKPAAAISVIETDCEVDFEAPKDYKEPERVVQPPAAPAAAQQAAAAPLGAAGAAAGAGGSAAAAAAAAEAVPEEPKFQAFVGSGRRLDGKPTASTSGGAPAAGAAAAAALARASANGAASTSSSAPVAASATQKAGTVVNLGPSTGNRLLDKLQREKSGSPGAAPPAAKQPAEEEQPEKPKFEAFKGSGRTLKG